MKTGYKTNRTFADKFEVQIKRILGELFFVNDFMKDVTQNTDLLILNTQRLNFACRVRKNRYLKYKNEITIRSQVPSGGKTEITKLIDGFGDYMFYGFCDQEEESVEYFRIIDLNVLRGCFIRDSSILRTKQTENGDGTAFIPINITKLPGEVVFYSTII